MSKRLDLLNRESFEKNVIKVVNQLSEIKKGCCFAIEGSWGVGKTFVIEEIEEKLTVTQSEDTNKDRYFVFHYNCWQHDYYEEPAIAIISAMLTSIKKDDALLSANVDASIKAGYKFAKDKCMEIVGLYIENKIGINIINLTEEIKEVKNKKEKAQHEFDKLFNFTQTIEKVRKKLKELAKERTLVLFVDELDRCIPQYAIKVLERLHHIFYGLDNVIVIMSIDRKQLEHSVEEMFGTRKDDSSIDIEKYLKKFIDFSVVLENGTINDLYWEKYKAYFDKFVIEQEKDAKVMANILPALLGEIDIRRQEKMMEKANIVHSLVCNRKVDVSVLFFEIMYEVFELYGFKFEEFWEWNDKLSANLQFSLVRNKLDYRLLREMEMEAWEKTNVANKKMIILNLYGKVFWYFASIFFQKELMPYVARNESDWRKLNFGLEFAKKYYEFRKIIR